jgi:hypothetical protein
MWPEKDEGRSQVKYDVDTEQCSLLVFHLILANRKQKMKQIFALKQILASCPFSFA